MRFTVPINKDILELHHPDARASQIAITLKYNKHIFCFSSAYNTFGNYNKFPWTVQQSNQFHKNHQTKFYKNLELFFF